MVVRNFAPTPPPLESRSPYEIMDHIGQLAVTYQPKWLPQPGDAGTALAGSFSDLVHALGTHLNRVPLKQWLCFLDLLDVRLIPAKAARAPLKFTLAPKAPGEIIVPKGFKVSAPAEDERPEVLFETTRPVKVSKAELAAFISADPTSGIDGVFDHSEAIKNQMSFVPFSGTGAQSIQEHYLYFGDDRLFSFGHGAGKGLHIVDVSLVNVESAELNGDWSAAVPTDESEIDWQTMFSNYIKGSINIIKTKTGNRLKLEGSYQKDENTGIKTIHLTGYFRALCNLKLSEKDTQAEEFWLTGNFDIECEAISDSVKGYNKIQNLNKGIFKIFRPFILEGKFELAGEGKLDTEQDIDIAFILKALGHDIGKIKITGPFGTGNRNVEFNLEMKKGISITKTFILNGELKLDFNSHRLLDCTLDAGGKLQLNSDLKWGRFTKLVPDLLENRIVLNNIESRWIRFVLNELPSKDFKLKDLTLEIEQYNTPDAAFFNDIPLNIISMDDENSILPFGPIPKLQDVFYLSSMECFSKPGSRIEIFFDLSQSGTPTDSPQLVLSWEYFNGEAWSPLTLLKPTVEECKFPFKFSNKTGVILFTCPSNIAQTEINGLENYWIRARIIGGNYGQPTYNNEGKQDVSDVTPPCISSINIHTIVRKPPDHCLTQNARSFRTLPTGKDKIAAEGFIPFLPLDFEERTLFLGFDAPLVDGPLSLYFDIERPPFIPPKRPLISWAYWSGEEQNWLRLQMDDATQRLLVPGTIRFSAPEDLADSELFGKKLWWIKGTLRYDDISEIEPVEANQNYEIFEEEEEIGIPPCEKRLINNLLFLISDKNANQTSSPRIRYVFFNTDLVVQGETTNNELLGSSNGQVNQIFKTAGSPVLEADVLVDELESLTSEQLLSLTDEEDQNIIIDRDSNGEPVHIWVRWFRTERLSMEEEDGRVFELDQPSGTIKFGNGTHGLIPPTGRDNIKVSYRVGGGTIGNLEASVIGKAKTSIPFLKTVINPLGAGGGTEVESIPGLLARASVSLRHRDRASSAADFEALVRTADPSVARVRCMSGIDEKGRIVPGQVKIVVVPDISKDDARDDPRPQPSVGLQQLITEILKKQSCANIVDSNFIDVCGPTYVLVSVDAVIEAPLDLLITIEHEVNDNLELFLHPVKGGFNGEGWEFGQQVCINDIYKFLNRIENIHHVASLEITVRDEKGNLFFDTSNYRGHFVVPDFVLPSSGEHKITTRAVEVFD